MAVLFELKLHRPSDAAGVDYNDPRWEPHVFAGALKLYLRELPEPVVTYNLYEDFVAAGSELRARVTSFLA